MKSEVGQVPSFKGFSYFLYLLATTYIDVNCKTFGRGYNERYKNVLKILINIYLFLDYLHASSIITKCYGYDGASLFLINDPRFKLHNNVNKNNTEKTI